MKYDEEKVDEVAFALLYLTLDKDGHAWKGMDWSVSDRLHAKGWIERPTRFKESFGLTPAGREACIRLFRKHFCELNSVGEADRSAATLLDLPVDIEALVYCRLASDDRPRYLDTATGLIVLDGEEGAARREGEVEANPLHIRIPKQTADEYLADVQAYARVSRDPSKKAALHAVLQQMPSPPDLGEISLLLRDDRQWIEWRHKQARKYIRQWLASIPIA